MEITFVDFNILTKIRLWCSVGLKFSTDFKYYQITSKLYNVFYSIFYLIHVIL